MANSVESTDLSYAAAIIEGEGCITISICREKNLLDRYCTSIQVSMNDPEAIEFLHKTFAGSLVLNGKLHRWSLYGKNAAAFLQRILPFLKLKRKIKNAEACIALQKRISEYKDFKLTPEERNARQELYERTRTK